MIFAFFNELDKNAKWQGTASSMRHVYYLFFLSIQP